MKEVLGKTDIGVNVTYTIPAWKEKKGLWVAWDPVYDIASQGKTKKEAIDNLKEAKELYLEDEDAKRPIKIRCSISTTIRKIKNDKIASPIGA